ncbi:hypothetical protein DL98DRAFT_583075 [Cadophora sp. DSE1049]|nr:hypothetical protein DL98DRAFT_583075 [Cadophora sp. DSE1049]
MARLLAYLTLMPTLFTFIAIVLINVGGVNPSLGASFSLMREKNSAFSLVKWDYTLSLPQRSSNVYSYHLFLNRLCVGYDSITSDSSEIVRRCRNQRISHFRDGSSLYTVGTLGRLVSPFRFTTINLDIPLAFYIMSAILVVVLMVMAFVGARSGNVRGGQRVAAFCSGVTFVFMIIASSIITAQMVQLRNQIRDNTRPSVRVPDFYGPGATGSGMAVWRVDISSVSLGTTVLGLTWAAVVALGVEFVMWLLALTSTKEEKSVVETKEDGHVHG